MSTARERFEAFKARSAVRRFRQASLQHFIDRAVALRWGHVRHVKGAATLEQLDAIVDKLERPWRRKEARKTAAHRRQGRDRAAVLQAFESLGDGLRGEEIAANTGLPEARVWKALKALKKDGWLKDRGEPGWFRMFV